MSILHKVFSPIQPSNTDVLTDLTHIQLTNYFSARILLQQHELVMLSITNNFLILSQVHLSLIQNYQGNELNSFCKIDFQLKFQVLRKQWPDENTPGLPIGIKFELGSHNHAVQFYHNHPAIIQQWISILSKRINQRNFHKLFKAKKKIGKGAFATVYLAERLSDKKMFAVKAFSKEKQYSGQKGKQSLQNEIKIMRKVSHTNIMTLQEVYQTQNSIYIILEYLEGKQLLEELKAGRKFTPEQCKQIIFQILSALDHLNSHRIIHRDLKPENIMFKNNHSLQLGICDFGLSTYADENPYLFVRCGTPGYVAPQIINIRDMNTRSEPISDIFSAGIILHYLLLGKSVFSGKKYNEVLAENRSCQFNFCAEQYTSISSQALVLLKSMLQKNPCHRITANQALRSKYFNTNLIVPSLKKSKQYRKQNQNKMNNEETQNQLFRKRSPFVQLTVQNGEINNGSVLCDMIDENERKIVLVRTKEPKNCFINNNSGFGAINPLN